MKKFLSLMLALSLTANCLGTLKTSALDSSTKETVTNIAENIHFGDKGSGTFLSGLTEDGRFKGWFGKVANPLIELGQLGYMVSGITIGLGSLSSLWYLGKSAVDKVKMKFSKVELNSDKVAKSMDEQLKKIKGQQKAKKKATEIVASIIDARNEAKENKRPYKKGDVIYMVGPSGVGKSLLADGLAVAIMGPNAKPIYVDASDIDKGSSRSLKEQLFYMSEAKCRNQSSSMMSEDTSIISQIRTNPNVVLIINEYDKMHTPDFDEVLRTIMDRGQISIYGEKIDCSGLLIIITSNEDHSSVTAGNNQGEAQDDGTGSRTHIVHDKSFLNRLNVIEFENLDEAAYEEITADVLAVIAKRNKEKYSVELDFGDTAKKIAAKTAKTNQGAREIEKIVAGLKSAIAIERQRAGDTVEKSAYEVDYDGEEDVFSLKKDEEIAQTTIDGEISSENSSVS